MIQRLNRLFLLGKKALRLRLVRWVLFPLAGMLVFFLLLDRLFAFHPQVSYSTQILAADGTVVHAFLNKQDKWRLYAEAGEITPLLSKTLIYKEDRFFYWHPGVNPFAMVRAFAKNTFTGRRTSGASTITMQVVRLLEPADRTYLNKFRESFRALQLEWHYSKDEILQLYLNLVPYGGNIEGIKSASLLYFGKPPQLLSLAEITALTIVPNRPSGLRPGTRNAALETARNKWLRRFQEEGLFDGKVIQDAIDEPLRIRRLAAPSLAPHLSIRLKKEFPQQPVIRTNLKMNTQLQIETQVKNYVNRLASMNIHNAAVLVINNETMAVEAYVGSADFSNPYDGGQVDGVRAVRSPGSTLKPLLYALAFDKGLLTPHSVLNDVPVNFAGYEPGNFDAHFNGPVTVESALANSLNVPAVKVLNEVGVKEMVSKLKKSGFRAIGNQADGLGLSMILGGCGVTLEELTGLFSCFSHDGEIRPLAFRKSEADKEGSGVVASPDAVYMINSILTQVTRPDLPTNFENTFRLPKIAWKTGTSYGKRDAWSIGYNQHYTVGVWVGNFSGEGVPELSGANIATPLLFSIFNSIDYSARAGWFKRPSTLASRNVCSVTGDVPSDFCTHTVTDDFIPGISGYRKCQHLRQVFVNTSGNISYCTYCLPPDGFEKRAYPNLAPELIAHYEQQNIPYQKIPPHNPACERVFHGGAPLITSLNDGSEYFVRAEEKQQLQLACQAENDVREVFWYVNDKLLKKAGPTEALFFTPVPGRIKLSCSDDKGRNSDIWITVKRL